MIVCNRIWFWVVYNNNWNIVLFNVLGWVIFLLLFQDWCLCLSFWSYPFSRYFITKSKFYFRVFYRIFIYGSISIFLLDRPHIKIFGFFNRDNPEYVKAVKNAWEHPDNKELWDEVERQKHLKDN